MAPTPLRLNVVTMSAVVKAITRYDDGTNKDKLVLTVSNDQGRYCVEYAPANQAPRITVDDLVLISGHLFTTRHAHRDMTKIRATSLTLVEETQT